MQGIEKQASKAKSTERRGLPLSGGLVLSEMKAASRKRKINCRLQKRTYACAEGYQRQCSQPGLKTSSLQQSRTSRFCRIIARSRISDLVEIWWCSAGRQTTAMKIVPVWQPACAISFRVVRYDSIIRSTLQRQKSTKMQGGFGVV